mmetsp:Transcript_412/g.962  ORF Transcript_412/g.962 Transcript_412/m.962 type:complete len:353 (-) Transcript_412:896-1954(-)
MATAVCARAGGRRLLLAVLGAADQCERWAGRHVGGEVRALDGGLAEATDGARGGGRFVLHHGLAALRVDHHQQRAELGACTRLAHVQLQHLLVDERLALMRALNLAQMQEAVALGTQVAGALVAVHAGARGLVVVVVAGALGGRVASRRGGRQLTAETLHLVARLRGHHGQTGQRQPQLGQLCGVRAAVREAFLQVAQLRDVRQDGLLHGAAPGAALALQAGQQLHQQNALRRVHAAGQPAAAHTRGSGLLDAALGADGAARDASAQLQRQTLGHQQQQEADRLLCGGRAAEQTGRLLRVLLVQAQVAGRHGHQHAAQHRHHLGLDARRADLQQRQQRAHQRRRGAVALAVW